VSITTNLYPPQTNYYPISNVTPFTYRDGLTFLEKLEQIAANLQALHDWSDQVVQTLVDLQALHAADVASLTAAITASEERSTAALAVARAEILAMVVDSIPGGVAIDPTTGLTSPVNTVISNVYDNVRVHAYFAKDLDVQNLTAAQIDALNRSARHFDLSPIDTTNDTLATA